jgi:DNA primase
VDTRRSLVRTAISLLLAKTDLAHEVQDLDWIETLEQPGIPLFVDLVRSVITRPGLGTGALLEAYAEHPQADALQKLAAQAFTGDDAGLLADFRGCVTKLRDQAIRQRLDWLKAQGQLDDEGKAEMRALLAAIR